MIKQIDLDRLDSFSIKQIEDIIDAHQDIRREITLRINQIGADAWKYPATYDRVKKYYNTGLFPESYKLQVLEILEQIRDDNLKLTGSEGFND